MIRDLLPAPIKDALKRSELLETLSCLTKSFPYVEPYESGFAQEIRSHLGPGSICADVGANIGQLTGLMAQCVSPGGRVVAFEAFPRNARILRRRIRLSSFRRTITVEPFAVMDRSQGEIPIFPGKDRASGDWNVLGRTLDGDVTSQEATAPTVSLDEYFESEDRLDLVKIDVEGAEGAVLAGMRSVLARLRPVVLVEFHSQEEWERRSPLVEAGYVLRLTEREPLPLRLQGVSHCVATPPKS